VLDLPLNPPDKLSSTEFTELIAEVTCGLPVSEVNCFACLLLKYFISVYQYISLLGVLVVYNEKATRNEVRYFLLYIFFNIKFFFFDLNKSSKLFIGIVLFKMWVKVNY
jgi:hypothetical protein